MKKENLFLILLILNMISIIPLLAVLGEGLIKLTIYFNRNEYSFAVLKVGGVECDEGSCFALGVLEDGTDIRLMIGSDPTASRLFEAKNPADLSRDYYPIYYLKDVRLSNLTIKLDSKDSRPDFEEYLNTGLLMVFGSLFIFLLLFYLAKKFL